MRGCGICPGLDRPMIESRIQAALEACVAAGAPGAIVAVEAPGLGVSFAGAAGRFAYGEPRPLSPEDPFRAASVTKAVTAAAAVRLAAEGRWSLDDPAARYWSPEVTALLAGLEGLDDVDALTLRRLLDHTAGVPDYFFEAGFQARLRSEPERTWRPAELVEAAVAAKRLLFPPGTGFSYGDAAYVLAGLAIEGLLGRPLADAYRSLVLAPLAMDATYLEWHEPRRGGEVSHPYEGGRDLQPANTSYDWAGGGLVTTAGDLVRFLRGLFGGALFGRRWLGEMTGWRGGLSWPPDSSARYLRYGLGIGVDRACGEEIAGATGVWGAFAYHWPARWTSGGAAIAGTVNLAGFDRTALLDAVVCALGSARTSSPLAAP